jgi:hypothetical protein
MQQRGLQIHQSGSELNSSPAWWMLCIKPELGGWASQMGQWLSDLVFGTHWEKFILDHRPADKTVSLFTLPCAMQTASFPFLSPLLPSLLPFPFASLLYFFYFFFFSILSYPIPFYPMHLFHSTYILNAVYLWT